MTTTTGTNGNDEFFFTYDGSADPSREVFNGGKGYDTLQITLSQDDAAASNFMAQWEAYEAKLLQGSDKSTPSFTFTFANGTKLTVTSMESVTYVIPPSTNTPPTIQPIDAVTITDTVASDDFEPRIGKIIAADADGDTLTYGIAGTTATGSYIFAGDSVTYSLSQTSAYGTVYLNTQTGDYRFEPLDAAINALGAGANPVVTFVLTVSDGVAPAASTPLTFNISGTNDAPTDIGFAEDLWSTPQLPGTQGQPTWQLASLNATDVDSPTVTNFSFAGGSATITVNGASFSISGTTLSATSTLAAGQTYALPIAATDASGDSYVETLMVRLGSNDSDTIHGSSGDDLVYSGRQVDIIYGYEGDDVLVGQNQNDQLHGGEGNDQLHGGAGNDTLTGGAGADTFVFNTDLGVDNVDTITDFVSGTDKIQLATGAGAPFAALAGMATSDAFGTYLVYDATTGALSYDTNGPDTAGGLVQFATLANTPTLTPSDFVFA